QHHRTRVGLEVFKLVLERFLHFVRTRFHVYAKRVFFLFISVAAPRARHFGENHRPGICGCNHVQPVNPFRERFAFHGNRIAEFDRGVFVRASAPNLSKRNKSAPDLAPIHERPVISDRDISQTYALLVDRELTGLRQIKIGSRRWDRGQSEKCGKKRNVADDLFHDGPELICNENSDVGILQGLLSATFATKAGHPRANSLGRQMISSEDYIEHRLIDQINWYDRKSAASHWLLLRGTRFLN